MRDNTIEAFFALVRAGLWGEAGANLNVDLNLNEGVEWEKIYQLAQEQSVQGLVLEGIEWFKNHNLNADLDLNIPKVLLLQWIGEVQVIEQRNKDMNVFIAELIEKLRKADIYALLVKGQGVAQCYEKPLWRCSGDVDLFLSGSNYENAKTLLLTTASHVDEEGISEKHLGMTIDDFVVELHGTLHGGLSSKVDGELDEVKNDTFYKGNVRSWNNNGVQIFLLSAENDVFYVFTHFLQHFYKEGVGLRQICDWCRLLYTYRDSLNYELLESRIKRAGLMSEWKAFYNLASRYLGMPDFGLGLTDVESAMPRQSSNKFGSAHGSIAELTVHDSRYDKKADKICEFILEVGNFGHNRDNSYFQKHSYFIQKCISAWRRVKDLCRHATIFPVNSVRFFFGIMHNGIVSAVRGE